MSSRTLRVFHRLQLAAHRVQKSADRQIGGVINITTAQAGVLSVLAERQGCTQKEVARALGHNESAVTPMVARLLRLGYVTRMRSPRDARAWQLLISEQGQLALQLTRVPFSRINKLIDDTLTTEEVNNLADYLSRLAESFDRDQRHG